MLKRLPVYEKVVSKQIHHMHFVFKFIGKTVLKKQLEEVKLLKSPLSITGAHTFY